MRDKLKRAIYIDAAPTNHGESFKYHVEYIIENPKETVDKFVNSLMEKVVDKKYTPKSGDKIYIYPDCDIPRFKIKQFCETQNVSIVKFRDKATLKIIGPKSYKSFFVAEWLRNNEKNQALNYFKKYLTHVPNINEFVKDVESMTADKVYFKFEIQTQLKRYTGVDFKGEYDNQYFFGGDENVEKFLQACEDTDLYPQDEILKKLNTGAVMDHEQYVSIQRLFQSKDTDNTKLAVEMMANCDFEKSSVYLLLLISKHGYKIWESPNRSHVNFKALIQFFSIKNLRSFYNDDIVECLLQRKLLNAHNLNVMIPILKEEVERNINTDYIKIKEIGLTDVVLKGLEENILDLYTDTCIEEFNTEEINPHL